jgi:hypothetical protein
VGLAENRIAYTRFARRLITGSTISMLLAWSVAVWKNPDLPPSPGYAAWVAGTLVVWFLLAGGWRVARIALGSSPKRGDSVYLGVCGVYAVGLLLYTAYWTLSL